FARNGSKYERRTGARTKIAHSPKITLGIAAKSSIANESGFRRLRGQSSLMKTATAIPSGTAITNAISDDKSVPYTNAHAPNSPATGSQELVMKNRQPNFANDSRQL